MSFSSKNLSLKDDVQYKKYYTARVYWLFKKISKSYIGYCVPEECTKDDIRAVVTSIFGKGNFAGMDVIDIVQFKKDTINWDIGATSWCIILFVCGIMAIVSTYKNQKLV